MRSIAPALLIALLLPGTALAISETERIQAISETDKALRSTDAQMKDFFKGNAKEEPVSGRAWLAMSSEEKESAVVHSMADLSERGIVFSRRPEEYGADVEQILKTNPSRQSELLTNLLAAVLYETEPESRAALEGFRTDSGV